MFKRVLNRCRDNLKYIYDFAFLPIGFRQMATATTNNESSGEVKKNQLSQSKSPYLQQHATNPVEWYPWGPEAIAKAKAEDKIIFLSVGYSTCHWCHVMEKESFENNEIAKVMNKYFVNVKVDREERPDIDKIYMTYVQATTGSGGWPMSVWLTPDLKPIYGGTYYPPTDMYYNRPGFKTVLLGIAKQWIEDRDKLERSGKMMIDAITRETQNSSRSSSLPTSLSFLEKAFSQLRHTYDSRKGGFGKAPKFPQPVNLKFLMNMYHLKMDTPDGQHALDMVAHTLLMISKGGIHDHVAQGVHRYSTDDDWHVPHFEKMLYDQSQLVEIYVDVYQATKDPIFRDMAVDILEYVSRDLRDKTGGFYSAEDADSLPSFNSGHKKEGAFCVWKKSEISRLLNQPVGKILVSDLFCEYYNIKEDGNVNSFQDPHGELTEENVLIIKKSKLDLMNQFELDEDEVDKHLENARKLLYKERQKRPKPHLDDKIIASWNGLMISAFAKAGQVFDNESYVSKATQAADFIENNLFDKSTKRLLRSCYRDVDGNIVKSDPPIYGFAEDYSFVIYGLINLFEASGQWRWLEFALQLQNIQDELFWHDEIGGYYQTDGTDPSVLVRLKDDQDGAQPSSNSVSTSNLLKLAEIFSDYSMKRRAEDVFKSFNLQLVSLPLSLPLMLCSYLSTTQPIWNIVIRGSKNDDRTRALISAAHSIYLPNKVVILVEPHSTHPIQKKIGILQHVNFTSDQPTAYACQGRTCSLPVVTPEKLVDHLSGYSE